MTAYRLEYSRRFLRRIEEVRNYIADHNPAAAVRTIERLLAAVARLQGFPAIGRPGRVDGTRELVIAGTPYIVPYRVADDTIEIVTVMHSNQRWPEWFP